MSFTTDYIAPTGAIKGVFSVSATKKVWFSKGNLQYRKSTNKWSFAENQYDVVETDNSLVNVGDNYENRDIISHFGWGTSGYNHGAIAYQPWNTSRTHSDYYAYGNQLLDLSDRTGMADWGYNAITNGGNFTNQWHTLDWVEWYYLFDTRSTNSGIRYAKACVNNVNGMILLPDSWNTSYFSLNSTNKSSVDYNSNIISVSQWATLEQHGAVFLPAVGYRYAFWVRDVKLNCGYWSSSHDTQYNDLAYYMLITDVGLGVYRSDREAGRAVRLVRYVE